MYNHMCSQRWRTVDWRTCALVRPQAIIVIVILFGWSLLFVAGHFAFAMAARGGSVAAVVAQPSDAATNI